MEASEALDDWGRGNVGARRVGIPSRALPVLDLGEVGMGCDQRYRDKFRKMTRR